MKLQQDLEWDPQKEQFINNDQANAMLHRQMREPWAGIFQSLVDDL